MNRLLESYTVDTRYPDVSGIEHLQMLRTRSRLAEIEDTLTTDERRLLAEADQRLIDHAILVSDRGGLNLAGRHESPPYCS